MGRAFEMECAKLAPRDATSREAIAFRIVTAVRADECDPGKLFEKATTPYRLVA
jgi:hypothetical protein